MTNVFGAKFLSTLSPVDISLDNQGKEEDGEDGSSGQVEATTTPVVEQEAASSSAPKTAWDSKRRIWGMVSKAGEGVGRSDNDRQFLYLNGRPVDMPKVNSGSRWKEIQPGVVLYLCCGERRCYTVV